MKFLHLSDLHLGRQLRHFSLQEEQTEMLMRIRQIAQNEQPDAILIAGDVYDRSVPPIYATQLLDRFLAALVKIAPVCVISGNHDSAERLAFLSEPLAEGGLHISPVYRGDIRPVTLCDQDGPVDIWLLPFLKPASVRPFFPSETVETTNDAVGHALRRMEIDPNRRNVLVAHQFVAGGKLSGSEDSLALADISVGGSDLVDARLFAPFDYVALGHLHRAQNVGAERIRYCGSPMAYDFSEARMDKSVTIAELDGDRCLSVRTVSLPAPRLLVELRGSFEELTSPSAIAQADKDAYTHIILTDDALIPDVMNRLRQVYPRITHLDWDNARTRQNGDMVLLKAEKPSPRALFAEFFQHMNGTEMNQEQLRYLDGLIAEIWEVNP